MWDPCFYNRKVVAMWKEVAITVQHTQQDFWKVWPQKLTKRTVIVTNPPFSKERLTPFFKFLTNLDQPFFITLHNTAASRLYFGVFPHDRIKRHSELEVFSLQKAHQMKQKGGRLAGFAGLTICAYYPQRWNFVLDERKFKRITSIRSLHSTK